MSPFVTASEGCNVVSTMSDTRADPWAVCERRCKACCWDLDWKRDGKGAARDSSVGNGLLAMRRLTHGRTVMSVRRNLSPRKNVRVRQREQSLGQSVPLHSHGCKKKKKKKKDELEQGWLSPQSSLSPRGLILQFIRYISFSGIGLFNRTYKAVHFIQAVASQGADVVKVDKINV